MVLIQHSLSNYFWPTVLSENCIFVQNRQFWIIPWMNQFSAQYFDRKSTKPVIFVCFMNEWPDSKIILTTRDRMWKFVFSVEYFRARVKPQLLIVKINNIQIISSCSVFIRVIVRELPSDSPLEIFFRIHISASFEMHFL